jgi:hypothetical protein
MMKHWLTLTCLFLLPGMKSFEQPVSTARFGKITPEDFQDNVYSIDSNAAAVVIADIGSSEIEANPRGGYTLRFSTYRRAHVLHRAGYDIGDVQISLYTDGKATEELLSLKASTYNLENGKVVETKLDVKNALFTDRINRNNVVRRFTLPGLKEGSIIEYQYTITSDFLFNLQPWEFQGDYPHLWSEYSVAIPEFYYYVTLWQGYQSFFVKEQKEKVNNFSHTEDGGTGPSMKTNFRASVTEYRWVMKDVPALREENYTSTLRNHIARIEFQLAEVRPPFPPKNIMGTWTEACDQLLKDENFGGSLSRDNPWLNDVMKTILDSTRNDNRKAEKIYAYVRDHLTCTNRNARMLDQPLKNVLKNGRGNVAEINLLLVAMLRKAGLDADPVLLSTRGHGYTYEMYPLLDRFNYVIAQLALRDQVVYLDASETALGFGKLDYDCYNGHARVVNPEATAIEFNPDSLVEKSMTSVYVVSNERGEPQGNILLSPGYYESLRLRDKIREKGKQALINDFRKTQGIGLEVSEVSVDSLDKNDDPLSIRLDFGWKQEPGNLVYLDPMFGAGIRENPFKAKERFYPVEMPYTIDQTYLLQMEIPPGYTIEELPQQAIIKLNENGDGLFEYRINEANGILSLRSRLRIKRSYFLPEEYRTLREFFDLVVKKHNEQVVFRKK